MALTKATAEINAWTSVAQNTMQPFATIDMTGAYAAGISVQAAIAPSVAHTGTRFLIQGLANTSGNADWVDIIPWVDLIGTADDNAIVSNPLALGATTILTTDQTGYTVNGLYRFILDGTLINSEIVRQIATSATPDITIADGTRIAHVVTTPLLNIAMSRGFEIPIIYPYARVIVDNTYDPDGAVVYAKVRSMRVTAL